MRAQLGSAVIVGLAVATSALPFFTACAGKGDAATGGPSFSSSGGATSSGSGGGTGGAPASTSSAAGGGAGGAAADAGVDAPAPEGICAHDTAFTSDGLSFAFPTPEPLAIALDELAYPPTAHALAIVLLAGKGPSAAEVAISATIEGPKGQVFPMGGKPDFVPAVLSPGSFATQEPAPKGWLRFSDEQGQVVIEMHDITLAAATKASCSQIIATLDAVIPASQGGVTITREGQTQTIAELAGEGGGDGGQVLDAGVGGWPIHAVFGGGSISFDFASP